MFLIGDTVNNTLKSLTDCIVERDGKILSIYTDKIKNKITLMDKFNGDDLSVKSRVVVKHKELPLQRRVSSNRIVLYGMDLASARMMGREPIIREARRDRVSSRTHKSSLGHRNANQTGPRATRHKKPQKALSSDIGLFSSLAMIAIQA